MKAIHAAPWATLAALLGGCLMHGLHVTAGLGLPPDLDALRDIGFAQGLLDGNWFGDPTYADAIRYYPPLVPALGALLAWVTGAPDLPRLWVVAGPWAGLLPVLAFFFCARRLFASDATALAGVAAFVVVNGAGTVPWVGGGYTPWVLTPLLVQAAFLATACLMHTSVGRARWVDAALIGLCIGVTFLGHVVPAVLLTAMLVTAAFASQGLRARTVAWLAVAAGVQLVAMLPYLAPLLIAYPLGIAHTTPGGWTAGPLEPSWDAFASLAMLNVPAALAAVVLWRLRPPLARASAAMLAAWIGVCVLGLARHYACAKSASDGAAACRVLVMPVHHFHLYVQVAGAMLAGWAIAALTAVVPRDAVIVVALLPVLAGLAAFATRGYDRDARDAVIAHADDYVMDLAVYRWVHANTRPGALFVRATDGARDEVFDAAEFAVMAAGRKLLATHILFSNPYVDWTARDRLRQRAVAWIEGDADAPPIGCAAFASGLFAVLRGDGPVPPPRRAAAVFATAAHVVYSVSSAGCAL